MTYEPITRPLFAGDDWHELRDWLYGERAIACSRIAGLVFDFYRRAAIVLDRTDDAVLESLTAVKHFDLRTLGVAHAHLAAYWRRQNGHVDPTIPGLLSHSRLVDEFEDWVIGEASLWIVDNPRLVRLFALVLVQQNTASGIAAEMDLWDELKAFYPIVPPENRDLFDSDESYAPYGQPTTSAG